MKFEYKVADSSGRIYEGVLTADSFETARKLLKRERYVILEIKEKREILSQASFFIRKKIKEETLYTFFRELSILLRSGITIDKALEILINTMTHPDFKNCLISILRDLREGKSVTQAFKDTGFFSSLILSIISAGESIGNLSQAFANIADYLRFQIQFKREIKEALTYPVFLISASLVSLLVIFKFILPRFFSVFGTTNLPFSAKLLLLVGSLFSGKGFLVLLGLFFTIFFLSKAGYLSFSKSYFHELLFRIPLVKNLLFFLDFSRFSYCMHSMLKSGLEFVDALILSKALLSSKDLKNIIENAISEIKRGKGISEAFFVSGLLPDIFHHMLKVGEETATLKEVFFELYTIYDEKFKSTTKRLLSLIEPLVITFTGLIVGFIVITLILTVMSVSTIKF